MGRKMQRIRVFLRIAAWGGGLQRHSPWKAYGGGGRAEGSHQTLGRKTRRKQWGVEGPSSKQGKKEPLKNPLIFPPYFSVACGVFQSWLLFISYHKCNTANLSVKYFWNLWSCLDPLLPHATSSLITLCGGRRSWSQTSRWRRTACWSTSRSAWAWGGRCRTTLLPPGTSSHCQPLATRITLSGLGVPDVHHSFYLNHNLVENYLRCQQHL